MADLRIFQPIARWCQFRIAINKGRRSPAKRDPMLICKHAENAIRWKDGQRLEAVVTDDAVFTFRELDDRANQVARFLIEQGLKSGDRIGLMFDKCNCPCRAIDH
jgi:acyl-CoA synthetase (AMP-forming)/AMP-acid ligase II